jgi:phospholipase A2
MSQYYSPLTDASVTTLKDHLSSRIHTHIANLSNFLTVLNASRHNSKIILHGVIQRYYQQNGTISLVDIFGMLLGSVLLSRKVTVTAAPTENDRDDIDDEDMDHWYSESIGEPSPLTQQKNDKSTETGTVQEDDGAEVKPRILRKNEIKLSKQREYFEDGSLPMPIYCAVRHEIEQANVTKAATMSPNDVVVVEEGKQEEEAGEEYKPETKENNDDQAESKENNEEVEKIEEKLVDEPNDLYQWFEFTPYDMGSEEINGKYI